MVKLFITSLILVCLPWSISFGQEFSPFTSKGKGIYTGLQAGYSLNSNILSAGFRNTLYKGGYLERSTTEKAANRLGNNNRLGGDASYGIFFIKNPLENDSTRRLGYFFGLHYKANLSAGFSSDAFRWVFLGNRTYTNQKAYLGGSRFSLLTWRALSGGLIWEKQSENAWVRYGLSASILQGRAVVNARLTQLEISMDDQAMYMDVKSRVRFSTSSANASAFDGRAFGAGLNAFLTTGTSVGTFRVEINDFGLMSFDASTQHFSNDTSFRWVGYRFNSLRGIGDSLQAYFGNDALKQEFNIKEFEGKATVLTPAWIKFAYEFNLGKQSGIEIGAVERLTYGWFPYLYGQIKHNVNEGFMLSTRLSYGGFGSLSLGFQVNKQIGKHVIIGLGSHAFEGFIVPKSGNGQSFYFSIGGNL